ncbi:heavy metal translocating P-type ATPase [Candidatus Poseidoniaceae archaeon]|nr:heavy metal translocating P-type ATPase [Candidatus Poseidoniaceae archaeon]
MSDELSHSIVQEDYEEFLSLEEGDYAPKLEVPNQQTGKSPSVQTPNETVAEVIDMEVLGEYSGKHTVSWPIQGMDCPHCASEAMSALNRLDLVNNSIVSATEGSVTIDIDFEKGNISQASAILSSLGNGPDIPFMEIDGVKASDVAARHSTSVKNLPRIFRRQPGVLNCEIEKEGYIIIQIVPNLPNELRIAMESSIRSVIGGEYRLVTTSIKRLTSGEWRMIGSGLAFVMLILVFICEFITDNPWVVGSFGLFGVVFGGYTMFSKALASIRNRQLGFQVLTSLAVIGASVLQAWEEALMVIVLVSWTEHMEGEALNKARMAMQGGLDRLPLKARRLPQKNFSSFSIVSGPSLTAPALASNQEAEEIPIGLVLKGDHLEIRSGELIPADGKIISGTGSINRAPLTGESVPEDVSSGDELQAGLTLARGPVTIEVTAVGEETRLSELIDKVHLFKEKPTRLQGALENFTSIWVPIVLFGAVLAWLVQPNADWKIILLLWVVACPCALLLASPVPHAASISQAAKSGAIARGGDVLESLSKVNLALLDKTGTLTSGRPRIGKLTLARGRRRDSAIALASGLEASSNHPYAQAIIELAKEEQISPTLLTNISDGEDGVHAKMKNADVAFVRADRSLVTGKLLEALEEALSHGHGASLLLKEEKPVALFTFIHDDLREGTDEMVKALYAQGINVEILSGDNQDSVNALAKSIGIPESAARGEMTPEGKVQWVQDRSKTHITMMVGDGFNDAAAMAAADIGIAIGTGESANLEAADVLIPGDDPRLISDLVSLSKRTHSILISNIVYSVFVTAMLVYAVLAGLNENLAFGVLVHELSVIGVIINGARLSGSGGTFALIVDIGKSIWTGTINAYRSLLTPF